MDFSSGLIVSKPAACCSLVDSDVRSPCSASLPAKSGGNQRGMQLAFRKVKGRVRFLSVGLMGVVCCRVCCRFAKVTNLDENGVFPLGPMLGACQSTYRIPHEDVSGLGMDVESKWMLPEHCSAQQYSQVLRKTPHSPSD